MKHANLFALGSALLWVAGCASANKVVVHDAVGPRGPVRLAAAGDGSLRVYSARVRAPVDLNAEEFFWNNDFGRNEFLYEPVRTDYTVYEQDGKLVQHVRNRQDPGNDEPALVRLPSGLYTIEAEAEVAGGLTETVRVPVVIENGEVTSVHLEPLWKPLDKDLDPAGLVRLADGRIIGYRAEDSLGPGLESAVHGEP